MESTITYEVHPKENIYFAIKVVIALAVYAGIFLFFNRIGDLPTASPVVKIMGVYIAIILLVIVIQLGLFYGYIQGNAVHVSERQFPDVYVAYEQQAQNLGMSRVPELYVLQAGGMLNAFAMSFMGSRFVVIYSDVLEEAYEGNMDAVKFVLGHELGHHKRRHLLKNFLTFPAFMIPFLSRAYSRACEYTCDNIGAALAPAGARKGLVMLAAGKRLAAKVNQQSFINQENTAQGFWFWFSEKLSTHPRLSRRLSRFEQMHSDTAPVKPSFQPQLASEPDAPKDYSSYMPR